MKVASPALKTGEIAFLGMAMKDAADPVNGWRTISLLSHRGKALMRCLWRQILPKVAPKISEAQFGRVPGKGTREAVEIIASFYKATKGPGKSRNPPMYLAAVLFDLEKAFDKVDRPTVFAALSAKAQMAGLDMYLEEMHDGTYHKTRDLNGQIERQVLISTGVRQGSVEGPLIFVACFDLVLHGIQGRREAAELSSISASSRATHSGDESVVPVNEIAFVDDLLPFLIFVSWEHLTGWIHAVIEVFEANHLKANVGKLEILLEAAGRGNARANRVISAGKVEIKIRGHKQVPKKKAVYLGVCLDISGSVAGETDERMTKAKRVHARLANNVWKSRLLTWNVKWRLWQALVLSVMIYCLEAHTLTGR